MSESVDTQTYQPPRRTSLDIGPVLRWNPYRYDSMMAAIIRS